MADIIQLEVTPDQFAKAVQVLQAPNNGVKSFKALTESTGEVVTGDLSFTYSYDGTRLFTMTITSRNSWKAKLASVDQIRQRLTAMLSANLS